MDIYSQAWDLQILPVGIKCKRFFEAYTNIPRLFSLDQAHHEYDKFPIPNTMAQFVQLKGLKIYSKFDLKARFWQLGIHPTDRPKMTFCIPDAQYQWTVMPFGFKVAPSLFQKAMTKIYKPIMHHTLIYIDDILLFFETIEKHTKLLH